MSLILSEVLDLDTIEFTEEEIRIGAIILYGMEAVLPNVEEVKRSHKSYTKEAEKTQNKYVKSPKVAKYIGGCKQKTRYTSNCIFDLEEAA